MEVVGEVRIEFTLEGADLERMIVVGGDLEFLSALPTDRLLTHTEVRLAAGVMRRLFVDGQLSALWRSTGAGPTTPLTVLASDLDGSIATWPEHWIKFAFGGGARTGAAQHTGFILGAIPAAEHEGKDPGALLESSGVSVKPAPLRMTLAQWLAGTSVAVQTNEHGLFRISRQSVLTYIANRKGGVHFDPRRDVTTARKPSKWRRDTESFLLDHGLIRVGHLSGPEYEVMSMVQAVAAAEWCANLIEAAERMSPVDFGGDPREMKIFTGVGEPGEDGWSTWRTGEPGAAPTDAPDST